MKTAIISIAAVNVGCPECGEGVESPMNFSFMFDEEGIASVKDNGNTVTCQACGTKFKLPADPWKPTRNKAAK